MDKGNIATRVLIIILVLILLIIAIFGLYFYQNKENSTTLNCADYSIDECPLNCVVCPPCEECSSLKCQKKESCEKIGFNKSWYNPPNMCKTRGEICPEFYHQVCGWFDQSVNCLKYPCAKEFPNECFACADLKVKYWVDGECPK